MDSGYRKANLIEGESYRLKQSRLAATTRSAGDFPELHEAVRDALRLGAVSFDAVKHLVLCRVEGRPQRLDLELYPHLPRVTVTRTAARDYMALMSGGGR